MAQWTKYTIATGCEQLFGGPAASAAVLEFLLQGRPEVERLGTWREVLEGLFAFSGDFRFSHSTHAVALLECAGGSGLPALAPFVCPILQNEDKEIVLATIACLARLGVPDAEVSAESLLTRLRAERVSFSWSWGCLRIILLEKPPRSVQRSCSLRSMNQARLPACSRLIIDRLLGWPARFVSCSQVPRLHVTFSVTLGVRRQGSMCWRANAEYFW